MIQKLRHNVHLIIAFFSDYLNLFGRPLFYQLQYQHFQREIRMQNHSNRLCILGNGPSFSLVSNCIDKLSHVDFCAVNLSINTETFFQIKPKMYVIVDMVFWMHLDKEKKISDAWENVQKVDWDLKIFIPFNFPSSMKKTFERNPYIKVCRYANNPWNPELKSAKKLKLWLYKMGLVSPNGTNVSIAAIYNALLVGYKDITLLGFEHSWMKDIKVNHKNEVVLIDRHYYGDTEHVWVDYEGKPIHLIDFLESQLATFTGHMYLRGFADDLGAKVINRTKDSYIDAYNRGSLEDFIEG